MSSRMNKSHPIAFQLLHNKSFAAKQTGSELSLKFNSNRNTLCGTEEGIFLADHFSAQANEIKRDYFARIRRSEIHFFLSISNIGIGGHKKAFTSKHSFPCRHQFSQKTF